MPSIVTPRLQYANISHLNYTTGSPPLIITIRRSMTYITLTKYIEIKNNLFWIYISTTVIIQSVRSIWTVKFFYTHEQLDLNKNSSALKIASYLRMIYTNWITKKNKDLVNLSFRRRFFLWQTQTWCAY